MSETEKIYGLELLKVVLMPFYGFCDLFGQHTARTHQVLQNLRHLLALTTAFTNGLAKLCLCFIIK